MMKDTKICFIKSKYSCMPAWLKILLAIILTSALIEIFIFNFRHWESLFYDPYVIYDYMNTNVLFEDGKSTIELVSLNFPVNNLYLDCCVADADGVRISRQKISLMFYGKDDANELYLKLGERETLTYLERTKYYRLNLGGNAHAIKIEVSSQFSEAKKLHINTIILNKPVPLMFSIVRFLAGVFLLTFIYLFHPTSKLYEIEFEALQKGERGRLERCLIIISCIMLIIFCIATVYANSKEGDSQEISTQYHVYAQSLAAGKVYLDVEPISELLSLSNPYDAPLRDSLLQRGKDYYGDWAFYNGKYYCYFGVLPVLLTFLPYYMLTGEPLPFSWASSIFGCLLIIGIFMFVYMIFQLCFKKAPLLFYFISCYLMVFCSGLYFAFRAVKFYALPILCAATLSIWGLYFWMLAKKHAIISNKKCWYGGLGTLLISLTALSRPQFLIVFVFAFIIFKDEIRLLIQRKLPLKFILSVLSPIVLVGAATMYFNYIRFGSVFDFGANYNLAGNDMRYRGWHLDRVFGGIYYYLFSPVITSPVFPFIAQNSLTTNYLGYTVFEEMHGGFFALVPFMMISLIAFVPKIKLDRYIRIGAITCVSISMLIIIADTQMAGIVQRYRMDFGWLLCLASILCCCNITQKYSDKLIVLGIRFGLVYSLICAAIYEFLLLFKMTNIGTWWHPGFYYGMKSLMQFWL